MLSDRLDEFINVYTSRFRAFTTPLVKPSPFCKAAQRLL